MVEDKDEVERLKSCTAKEKEYTLSLRMVEYDDVPRKKFGSRPKENDKVLDDPTLLEALIKSEKRCRFRDKNGKKVVPPKSYHDVWLLSTQHKFIWLNK